MWWRWESVWRVTGKKKECEKSKIAAATLNKWKMFLRISFLWNLLMALDLSFSKEAIERGFRVNDVEEKERTRLLRKKGAVIVDGGGV